MAYDFFVYIAGVFLCVLYLTRSCALLSLVGARQAVHVGLVHMNATREGKADRAARGESAVIVCLQDRCEQRPLHSIFLGLRAMFPVKSCKLSNSTSDFVALSCGVGLTRTRHFRASRSRVSRPPLLVSSRAYAAAARECCRSECVVTPHVAALPSVSLYL